MATGIDTSTATTYLDLLNLVEGRLKELLPEFKESLNLIKVEFGTMTAGYGSLQSNIGKLEDLLGHLNHLRMARPTADNVTIALPKDLADRLELAAADAQGALKDAANLLAGLECVISEGTATSNDPFVTSSMRLACRALTHLAEDEGGDMEHLARLIRLEQKAMIDEQRGKAARS